MSSCLKTIALKNFSKKLKNQIKKSNNMKLILIKRKRDLLKLRTLVNNLILLTKSLLPLLKKVLLPYIQLDLLAQFIYQIPIPAFYEDSNKQDSATRIIGIFQLWFYDSEVKLLRFSDLMWYVALKAFIYAVIRIQI